MKIRVEVEVGPTELREFLGLPDVASVQQEALDAVVNKLRSGATSGSEAVAQLRALVPEGLASLSDWQRIISRALQTGRPVTVETTVKPKADSAAEAPAASKRRRPAKKKTRTTKS
ncbi:MAG: hypothetical protein ACNA8J_10885 [Gammaproteobacteria bacterium]